MFRVKQIWLGGKIITPLPLYTHTKQKRKKKLNWQFLRGFVIHNRETKSRLYAVPDLGQMRPCAS